MTEAAHPPPEEVRLTTVALRQEGIDFALLSTPANVTYVSGWEAPIGVGPIWEIAASLPLAFALVSAADGAGSLITPNVYASGAASKGWFADVTAFDSLGHFEELDPPASFKEALVVARLPKTRSGKILRSTMRAIANGRDYSVPSTIDDPAILDEIGTALKER